jgi:hypothetical protein
MSRRRSTWAATSSVLAVLVLVASYTCSTAAAGSRTTSARGAEVGPLGSEPSTHSQSVNPLQPPSNLLGSLRGADASISPHSGSLDVDYIARGMSTVDPAVATDYVDAEAIMNVYETLVSLDGNSTTSFVPTLATCVPGTTQCVSDYGSSLVGYENGEPVYWTFVIDSAARFYDPTTSASWGVYPSDVMFSVARELAFADTPWVTTQPGWALAQALLPLGNPQWDVYSSDPYTGIHFPYNNTPGDVLSSMLVNDTGFCPATALENEHGCVTFIADGSGQDWPYFLQTVASALVGSVTSCGWVSANGGAVPGFDGTDASNGDGPCQLPSHSVSTSAPSFQAYLHTLNVRGGPYSWDDLANETYEFPSENPVLQWGMMGSGPYSGQASPGAYNLQASPAFAQPSGCATSSGLAAYGGTCDPPAAYIPVVHVTFDASDVSTISAAKSDGVDFATFFPTDSGMFASEWKFYLASIASFSTYLYPFNLDWSSSTYSTVEPSGIQPPNNLPADFFSGVAARELLVQSYPFAIAQDRSWFNSPIEWLEQGGGPIPLGMANYYPANVSFPSNGPDLNSSHPGGAAWWWSQGTSASSEYYDPELAACTHSNPCIFPIVGVGGDSALDLAVQAWVSEIEQVTGGALQPRLDDAQSNGITPIDTIVLSQLDQGPDSGAFPVWPVGWSGMMPAGPVTAQYGTDGIDSIESQEETISSNWEADVTKPPANPILQGHMLIPKPGSSVAHSQVSLLATASCPGIGVYLPPTSEYLNDPTTFLTAEAFPDSALTSSDAVCEEMGQPQYNAPGCAHNDGSFVALAYWSNVGSVNNSCQGVAYATALTWMQSATQQANETLRALIYNLVEHILTDLALYLDVGQGRQFLASAPWIAQSSINANPAIGGAGDQLWFEVRYAPDQVTFQASGLPGYGNWSVAAGAPFPVSEINTSSAGGSGTLNFTEPPGVLPFTIAAPNGYAVRSVVGGGSPSLSSAVISGKTTLTVTFAPLVPFVFAELGLPAGTAWTVAIVPDPATGEAPPSQQQTIAGTEMTYFVLPYTYAFTIGAVPGFTSNPRSGTYSVTGTDSIVNVQFSRNYSVEFEESGLPTGTGWTVWMGGVGQSSTGGSLTFSLPNGTYSYQVGAPLGYSTSPVDGTLTVRGAGVVQNVPFAPTTYTVTFSETGLASGTTWHVLLDGIGLSGSGATLSYPMWIGTWAYTIGLPSGCSSASPSSGSVVVVNGTVRVSVRFAPSGCGGPGGGGGGGCVDSGTPILTPGGYIPVQFLKPGFPVIEYNFTSGHLTVGKLVSASTTAVDELIDINAGWLYLTLTDQPIYIRNSTFEGWLSDPQNLSPRDAVYDPVDSSWIVVVSITRIHEETLVYDVVTTGFNNFVGNGALLDLKAGEVRNHVPRTGVFFSVGFALAAGGLAIGALIAATRSLAHYRRGRI